MDLKLDLGCAATDDAGMVPDLPEGGLTADDIDDEGAVELGSGAGGRVALVKVAKTGEPLARKSVCLLDDEAKRKEVQRELSAYLSCKCDQLVRFFGAYYTDADHTVHLLLEYMNLGSLQDVIDCTELVPPTIVSHLTLQTLLGLDYLHHTRKGIHRDIKPGNILINSKGSVKLTDFGVAREMDDSVASAGTFVGTLQYMAPERLQGGSKYTNKADIWSLGLTIVQIATLKHPYEGVGTGFFNLFTVIKDQPSPTLPDGSDFPKSMCQWVDMCLLKDPVERAGTVELLKTEWMEEARELRHNKDFHELFAGWCEDCADLISKAREEAEAKKADLGELR